jgi:hypothetical protein
MSRRLTGRGQAEDQVKASWWTHAGARGGWIGGKCQRPEALPDHLALRDDHRLAVEQVAGRWQARVIFDL